MKLRAETERRMFSSRVPVQSAFAYLYGRKNHKNTGAGLKYGVSLLRTAEPCFRTGILHPEFGLRRIRRFCAFAEKNAVFLANQGCKGSQTVNRHTFPEFGFAEFWSFGTGNLHKTGGISMPKPLSLDFSRFFKSEVSPAFPKQKQDSSTRLTARSE